MNIIRIHLIGKWLLVIAILGFGLLSIDSFQNHNICKKRRLLIDHKTLSKSCGLKHPQVKSISRIIGGKNATAGQFPFAARIAYKDHHGCGASILNSKYLLTAAHCLPEDGSINDEDPMTIHIGDHFFDLNNKNDCSTEFKVKNIYPHPNFDGSKNDIGIIELERPIKFGYYDKGFGSSGPICLIDNLNFKPGSILRLAGWGKTGKLIRYVLQFDDYKVIDCSRANKDSVDYGHNESVICTKTDTRFKSDFTGDSGSGLFGFVESKEGELVSVLVGVVNRGLRYKPEYQIDSIYARVNFYKGWIEKITRQKLFTNTL